MKSHRHLLLPELLLYWLEKLQMDYELNYMESRIF